MLHTNRSKVYSPLSWSTRLYKDSYNAAYFDKTYNISDCIETKLNIFNVNVPNCVVDVADGFYGEIKRISLALKRYDKVVY